MIMKLPERFHFLANVLTVTCSRPNAEVGKLVKAAVTYVTEGTKTDLDDLRLQAYYDLLIQDIDSMRAQRTQLQLTKGLLLSLVRNHRQITLLMWLRFQWNLSNLTIA